MLNKLSQAVKAANSSSQWAKKLMLTGSVATLSAVSFAVPAFAQSAPDSVEEVTVTGIRASLQAALETKRNSTSIVDAVTSEDVGKFPDKNVAESLQRIPGVTIQRGFGEGAAVSIRGTGQDLTLTTLNGQNVASTGWFVLEPARRSFNYELLPSELVGGLEVYKSTQADIAEGGVGGTVVVHTRKPLEMGEHNLFGSVEMISSSDSSTTDPKGSLLGTWKNEAETFGLIASAVYQKRELQRQGNEAFWEWGAGPVAFQQDRQRDAETLTLQFKPNDQLDVVVNAINMKMDANNVNYALWLTQGNTSWSGNPRTADQLMNGETAAKGPLNVGYYQARPREATMKSSVYDMDATYHGDDFELHGQVGTTHSSGGTDFEMVLDDGTGGTAIKGGSYNFFGGKQTWNIGDLKGGYAYNPGSVTMGTGDQFNKTPKEDGEDYIQGDAKFDVDFGAVNAIKAGAKFTQHNTWSKRVLFNQKAGFNNVFSTAGKTATLDAGAGSYSIFKVDINPIVKAAKASIIGETEDMGSHQELNEDNSAAYVMANFEDGKIKGNLGVRYISSDVSSVYYVNKVKKTEDASYDMFLPSLNVSYNLADDLLLRAAAGRSAARPQYSYMYFNPSPSGTNDETPNNQFWVSGNPALKPYVSDQFDIGVEYYFAEKSLLSVTFFTKNVSNFISYSTKTNVPNSEVPFQGVLKPNETSWTVQTYTNGKQATAEGLELQYQQDFGNGFGALVNYTYTDTSTDKDSFADMNDVLSDSSKQSYNVTGYYENDSYSVRLAYNFRSDYMLREAGAYGNRLQDGFGTLDLSAVYNLNDNVSFKLDGNNLLSARLKQFGNNQHASPESGFTEGFPLYEYEMSRNISLGVNFKW